MPRYFFDLLENGSHIEDKEGADIPTREEVRYEAMRALPAIARDQLPKDGDQQIYTVLVRDEDGEPVYTATLNYAGLWLAQDKSGADT